MHLSSLLFGNIGEPWSRLAKNKDPIQKVTTASSEGMPQVVEDLQASTGPDFSPHYHKKKWKPLGFFMSLKFVPVL
jgi:hypothetical protein